MEQSVDVGGTTLPGLTLETAKEHTSVSCGWQDARDACKAWPTIEAQGLAGLDHRSPAWPHRPIKTGLLLFFLLLLPSSVSLSSLPLSLSLTFSLVLPLPFSQSLTKHARTFLSFPFCLSNCWGLKRGMKRREWDWEKEAERENQRERGPYHRTSTARTHCTGLLVVKTSVCMDLPFPAPPRPPPLADSQINYTETGIWLISQKT